MSTPAALPIYLLNRYPRALWPVVLGLVEALGELTTIVDLPSERVTDAELAELAARFADATSLVRELRRQGFPAESVTALTASRDTSSKSAERRGALLARAQPFITSLLHDPPS